MTKYSDIIFHLNEKFKHKFINSDIKRDYRTIFICTECQLLIDIWNDTLDAGGYKFNNQNYEIYLNLDDSNFHNIESREFLTCEEQQIKNIIE